MSPARILPALPLGEVAAFFDSQTWIVLRNVLLFFLVVFWLAVAYWVFKDARRRIEDPWLVAIATLLGLILPFLGALIYMLFRPPEYLDDVHERELEMRAMEERLLAEDLRCPVCRAEIEPGYLVCPICTTRLKQACAACKAPLEPEWQVCPHCETPVPRRPPIELADPDPPIEAPPHERRSRRARPAE